MGFPQEFPKQATSTLLALLGPSKPGVDQVALAGYDLLGYGLGLYFGDAKYVTGLDLGKLMVLLASPEFAKVKEAAQAYFQFVALGDSRWRAALKVLLAYGPDALALVLKVIEAVK